MSGLKRLTKFSLAASAAAAALTIFAPGASAQAQQVSANAISIESQDLGSALRALARQTGTQVVFDPATVSGRRAPAVDGATSPEQALRRLLADTGLTYRSTGAGTYTILAQAAEAPPTQLDGADQATSSEEEIVVTAQKREERLQDVPISVSVLGGRMLDNSTSQGVTEALNSVPGVATTESYIGTGTQISVRGVSSSAPILHGASPVAYYLDSMPFGLIKTPIAPDANAYDLERVEVLRGPQGTLYGANALNGVVRVLTHDADLDAFDFKARSSVSSTEDGQESYRGDVSLNLPLAPGLLAARVVVGYQDLGGWIDRPNNPDANDATIANYRLRLRFQPTDDLSIGFTGWSSRARYDNPPQSLDNGTHSSLHDEPTATDFDTYGVTVGYDFGGATLTSMTSYLEYENHGQLDLVPYIGVDVPFTTDYVSNVFSQEMVLSSDAVGLWRWSVGGIYRDAEDQTLQSITGLINPVDFTDTSESYAAYGEVTRVFNDGRWELTGGLRYFHDTEGTHENVPGSGVPGDPLIIASDEFEQVTPRIVLTWHPSSDLTLYGSYAEGFRSGFQQIPSVTRADPTLPPVGPDSLRSYEIGAKASNLWGGRMNIETAIYYLDWQEVQNDYGVDVGGGIILQALRNSGSASGPGIDFAVNIQPTDRLSLGFSAGWNDLTFDDNVLFGTGVLYARGERLNFSPEYSANASAEYAFPIGSSGFTGTLAASANYTSAQEFKTTAGHGTGDDVFTARTRFMIEAPTHWTASLYIDNLTDWDGSVVRTYFNVPDWETRIRPRTIGVQVEYRY